MCRIANYRFVFTPAELLQLSVSDMKIKTLLPALLLFASAAETCLAAPMLAVVARADGTVNLYKTPGLQLIKAIPAGKRPSEICVAPNGKLLFVAQPTDKAIGVIDLATQAVIGSMTDAELKNPDGCAVSPDSSKMAIVDAGIDKLYIFATESRQLLFKIAVGKQPRRALFARDGKTVLVSNAHADTLSVIDVASGKVTRTVKTGKEPRELMWTPDGKFLLVSLINDDSIAYFKGDTLEFDQQVGTERSPQRMAITPDGETVFSLSRFMNAVTVMDLSKGGDRRVVSSIPVGKYAFNMAMSDDGKYVFTGHTILDNTLSVIDVRLMKVINTIQAGKDTGAMIYIK